MHPSHSPPRDAEPGAAADVRRGSPFDGLSYPTPDPDATIELPPPWNYPAAGARIAAAAIVPFGIAAALTFPTGGIGVSVLGVALSLFSLPSPRPWIAVGLLFVHGTALAWTAWVIAAG